MAALENDSTPTTMELNRALTIPRFLTLEEVEVKNRLKNTETPASSWSKSLGIGKTEAERIIY